MSDKSHSPKFLLLMTVAAFFSLSASRTWRMDHEDELVVWTRKGLVRGKTIPTGHGKEVDAFLGIPFAKPPLGKYRFRPPEPVDSWNNVFNATSLPNSCVQINDTFFGNFSGSVMWNANTQVSEDCLQLNVWVPRPRPEGSAVLVWIYGGGFYSGTTTLDVYDPKVLCSEEEIIVVSMNYRVASLGFLFFDRPDAPGNVGLLDQVMALEWIRDNIDNFGGDPNNVTLMGESAGAGSVGLHLLSPVSRSLFNRGILQSGSPVAPWSILDRDKSIAHGLLLAKSLGCPDDFSNLDAVLECLRSKDPFEMVNNEWQSYGILELPFLPVVDGVFITEMPQQSLATKNFKEANVLMGSNSEEGSYFIIYFFPEHFKLEDDVHIDRQTFVDSVRQLYPRMSKLGQDAIVFHYTDWEKSKEAAFSYHDAVDKIVGDYHFTCSVNELGLRYAQAGNDVYMYFFAHRSSRHPWPRWMGVMHADEINFVFGEPLNPAFGYTEEEVELSKRIMHYWSNFAKTGNPSIREDGGSESVSWPLHSASGREYLTLATNSTEVGKARRAKECVFWNDYQPKLAQFTLNC